MKNPPVKFEIQPNGDLKITATEEYRNALADMVAWFDEEVIYYLDGYLMRRLVEQYSEYQYEYFESNADLLAREGISIGLTSAPVLVERASVDPELEAFEIGEIDELSKFWAFEPYALRSEIDDLVRNGYVVFKFLGTDEEQHEKEAS